MSTKRPWSLTVSTDAEKVSPATMRLTIRPPAVREIIRKTGFQVVTSERRLMVALNRAYEAAAAFEGAHNAPTQVQTFKKLEKIRDTALELASLLGVATGSDIRVTNTRLFDVLCHEADAESVVAAVMGVERLHRWTDRLTDQRPKNAPVVHTRVMFAIEMLPDIYQKHFRRPFGITMKKKVAGGPALRFVLAVLDAIEAPMSASAVAKAWHRHQVSEGKRQR